MGRRRHIHGVVCLIALSSGAQSAACSDQSAPSVATKQAQVPAPSASAPVGYPPGKWRLAPDEIEHVIVSVAHILVAHSASRFRDLPQYVALRPTQRSKAAALELAHDLAEQVQRQPERFAEIAAAQSDDLSTADWGGRIGVCRADQLLDPFLDALARLEIGEISHVVETPLGYHVLRRLAVEPPQALGVSHVVIKYERSAGRMRPGRTARRTREQARDIAYEAWRQLSSQPQRFVQIVDTYSDAYDALGHGDFGVWSTHDRPVAPLALEVASQLRVGEVSGIIDGFLGFEIMRRDPATPRAMFSASTIIIAHAGTPAWALDKAVTRSKAAAEQLAGALARRLSRRPDHFDQAFAEHCETGGCLGQQPWSAGRGNLDLERVVARMSIGEVAATPIESELGYYVMRRDDPAAFQWPADHPLRRAPQFSLPEPRVPEFATLIEEVDSSLLAGLTLELKRQLIDRLGLTDDQQAAKLEAIFDKLAMDLPNVVPAARGALLRDSREQLNGLLGPELMYRYDGIAKAWLLRQLLARTGGSPDGVEM